VSSNSPVVERKHFRHACQTTAFGKACTPYSFDYLSSWRLGHGLTDWDSITSEDYEMIIMNSGLPTDPEFIDICVKEEERQGYRTVVMGRTCIGKQCGQEAFFLKGTDQAPTEVERLIWLPQKRSGLFLKVYSLGKSWNVNTNDLKNDGVFAVIFRSLTTEGE
jgi:hypothetical protein